MATAAPLLSYLLPLAVRGSCPRLPSTFTQHSQHQAQFRSTGGACYDRRLLGPSSDYRLLFFFYFSCF
jgi:hypothetical protein